MSQISTSNKDKLRILILTSSTGGGHDRRAHSFECWIQKLYPESVDLKIEQLLENSHWLTRFGVWVYNQIQKRAPCLHNIYWHIAEYFAASQNGKVHTGGNYYRNLLSTYKPHVIFSVHDCLNRGYFEDARSVLGKDKVKCITYCGEWTGGFGYSKNWVNPSADWFVSRTTKAQDYAIELGLKPSQCSLLQNFLRPAYFEKEVAQAKDYRTNELQLDESKFTVLLATGQYGANNHLKFLDCLLQYSNEVQAIVVCGRNKKILKKIQNWSKKHPQFDIYIEGFSTKINQLLLSSDAVVSRGGSNTTTEALYNNCPIIFNALGGIMPQEQLTLNYFLEQNAATKIHSTQDFENIIKDWKNFTASYKEIKANLAALKVEDTPEFFTNKVVALAQEAQNSST